MRFPFALAAFLLAAFTLPAAPQHKPAPHRKAPAAKPAAARTPAAPKPVAPAHAPARASAFAPYDHCSFDDGLALTDRQALPQGVKGRTVDTFTGTVPVAISGGQRLLFSYPGTDIFANVKVEQLPAASFDEGKASLVANFEKILASDDGGSRNYSLKPRMNGLEIMGLDRVRLEGNTVGIYLFSDPRTHLVTTIYFLNAEPARRRFSTLGEYASLRDRFLETFTGCIAGKQGIAPASSVAATQPAPTPAAPVPAAPAPAAPALAAQLPDAPQPASAAEAPARDPMAATPAPAAATSNIDRSSAAPVAAPKKKTPARSAAAKKSPAKKTPAKKTPAKAKPKPRRKHS